MAKEKALWNQLVENEGISTGENSQIRVNLSQTTDDEGNDIVSVGMHKWAKYITATDKMGGITSKESVPFRPTGGASKQTLAFPPSAIPAIIADLQKVYDHAVKAGIIDTVPQKATKPIKTPRKKV